MLKKYLKRIMILGTALLVAGFLQAQELGFQVGAVLNLGTHVTNIGFNTQVYVLHKFVQVNVAQSTKINFYSYGKRKNLIEHRLAAGLLLMAGKQNITPDFHYDALNHQSRFQSALGFNYILYNDNRNTSQLSGAWSLHHNYFSLYFENDVFGGQAKDRFRSGILQFNYRYRDVKYFTNLYIWTGETAKSIWVRETKPGCPNGYRSLADLPYGKTSHGIWSVGAHVNAGHKQVLTAKAGIDSEQIRHAFQNRISHDLMFLPKSVKRHTPHYPRLDKNGMPVFTKEEIRKNRLYLQVNLNDVWSN